jgi:hypothetical protein
VQSAEDTTPRFFIFFDGLPAGCGFIFGFQNAIDRILKRIILEA